MGTMILQSVGGAVGGGLAGPIGALLGRTAGAIAGGLIDQALSGRGRTRVGEGPRLSDLAGLASTEGAPVPRVYGRARIGGEIIWATAFEEVASTDGGTTGGKSLGSGGGGSSSAGSGSTRYFANLAVGLCEGPVAFVRRIWADDRELDLTTVTVRVHVGSETQEPDPLIVAREGQDNAPAYRGLAYVVFERLPLADFGNRVPQLNFEVVRPIGDLNPMVRAVNVIPGSGEFAYDTMPVVRSLGPGASAPENRHVLTHATDWEASIDTLQAVCPNLEQVGLVVSWFGDDLRAGRCRVAPRVELPVKDTGGMVWRVGDLGRPLAEPTSTVDGRPAYGGTPSDEAVVRAIRDLRSRGLGVTLYPFVLMDIPAGNGRADPWTGAADQPAYPWRGRLTCDPAPDRPGTADGTDAAARQVAAVFGKAAPGDFNVSGGRVSYRGPTEWTLRRQVLHYAWLARAAGGVEAFLIGSELVGLTRVRGAGGSFPAVEALVRLAADVRSVLGAGTKITYAADWTEYCGQVLAPGDLAFPLDALWASPAVDMVGIDFYPPLTDWRDGGSHADAAIARSCADAAYLESRFGAGEAFDWSYASERDRASQTRSPIADAAYGKPWVYRPKDLVSWWSNPHVERRAGVEQARPTAWVPGSKPIWLTEFGCPAVDKGPNRPSAFPDPKSNEAQLPPFSRGFRDDRVQLRALEAVHARFGAGADETRNPRSPIDGTRMVEPNRIHLWAWDARPFPAFPDQASVWADGANWSTGHWLNGRLEGSPLDALIVALLRDFGMPPAAGLAVDAMVDGYVVDRPMSLRDALDPLLMLAGVDVADGPQGLRFTGRGVGAITRLGDGDLVPDRDGSLVSLQRTEDSALPRELRLSFTDAALDYRRASVASRRLTGATVREAGADLAVVMERAVAQQFADVWLHDLWAGRETASFRVRPSMLDLEPGDVVSLPGGDRTELFRITSVQDTGARTITARAIDPSVWSRAPLSIPRPSVDPPPLPGPPLAVVIDWPGAHGDPPVMQSLAVFAAPWTGPQTLWRSADGSSFTAFARVENPARIGTLLTALPPGPLHRWDLRSTVDVQLMGGQLSGLGDLAALDGRAALAVQGSRGWEVLGFARAELVGPLTWRLSRLLRGLMNSEAAAAFGAVAGSRAVVLDAALLPIATGNSSIGESWLWRLAPAGRSHAGDASVSFGTTTTDRPLRPLAPVRVTAVRRPAGVEIGWIRRSRLEADAWGLVDIPLGEASEAYRLDIMAGGSVRRRLVLGEPRALYAAADEIADFGRVQAELTIRLAQLSATVGAGDVVETILPVS